MAEPTESMTVPQASPGRVPIRAWTVEVVAGPAQGQAVTALQGLVRVGTDPGNELVLDDPTVSRRHLEIAWTGRGLVLKDLGSRNGTFLQGRRVQQVFVQPGDQLELGQTRLELSQQASETQLELDGDDRFGDLVGGSQAMRIAFAELRHAAASDTALLIEGETGTGKELAARAVHAHSIRRFGPFRVVDCALLSETNAERELFEADGAFSTAQGGTLFLDEVAELPHGVQQRLQRVLETRELGGRRLDLRVLASTARNLAEDARLERFRPALYHRLSATRVKLPPLRSRTGDLPALARALVGGLAAPIELSPQLLALLEGYDWPGNVRELRNVLERGALLQTTGSAEWLELLVPAGRKAGRDTLLQLVSGLRYHEARDRVMGDFERHYFAEVLREAGFDLAVASERTGLSMPSLYRLLKKNGLRLKDLKNAEGAW